MKSDLNKVFTCVSILLLLALFNPQLQAAENSAEQTRLNPLAPAEWTPQQKKVLESVTFEGKVLNVFSTLVRNPELLNSWNGLGTYLLKKSALPVRDREILILRTAWNIKSTYEFSQHVVVAEKIGMSHEEIAKLAKNIEYSSWSGLDAVLVKVADELHRDATISEPTWLELSKHYDEKQLLDVMATVGQYRMLGVMLNSLRVPLDDGITPWSFE